MYHVSGGLVSIDQVGAGPTEYIRASGMTLARVAGAAVTWLHPDHLGSAVAGTGAAGSVVWRESEQPFGEDWISAPANDNHAGYTGHVEDAATGLVYMQARYYEPVIGRFLANDPVGFSPARPDMFNRYAYAANDPVNAWDPDGRDTRVQIRAYRLRGLPGALSQGHAFIQYTDTNTGESRISRAGPGIPGDGGHQWGYVTTDDRDAASSIDTREPAGRGIETDDIADVTIPDDFADVQDRLNNFNDTVDSAQSPYDPLENNSNTYTGDGFEAATGQDAPANSGFEGRNSGARNVYGGPQIGLPGYANDLDNVDPPQHEDELR